MSPIIHASCSWTVELTLVRFSDVGCKTVANMIKGKTPEEIRKLFNIVNDFTPEEEVKSLPAFLLHWLTHVLQHRLRSRRKT